MNTIERLPLSEAHRFREHYLARRQPVIITGLFPEHRLADIRTLASARERLGDLELTASPNYMDMHLGNIGDFISGRGVRLAPQQHTQRLADYLAQATSPAGTTWIITENPTPASLLEGMDLRPLGLEEVVAGYGNPQTRPESHKAYSLTFVGSPGNASDLHTDWDGRDVLLYQVFGSKRATLFPPQAAAALLPIDIYSMVRLRGMPEPRRNSFVQSLGGVDLVLEPGEALFTPAFWWHHLEYVDTGMSISFRFGGPEDEDVRFLIHHLHRDRYTQNLLATLMDPEQARAHRGAVNELLTAYRGSHPSARAKYRALRALASRLHQEICAEDTPLAWIDPSDFLESILCFRYMRPLEAWSPLQKRLWQLGESVRGAVRAQAHRLASWV